MCSRVRLLLNSAALVCQTGLRWVVDLRLFQSSTDVYSMSLAER
ncbi:hypothetical protein NC652_018143 [Populus alba x Populus x berolinensis]|nr:hypothetical protein NC652_018143 [Populus alba x Populus x berolinensis]KAJ6995369.1 hypothetical protein NC653_017982 [Populus alba x Populus x berolinensis]